MTRQQNWQAGLTLADVSERPTQDGTLKSSSWRLHPSVSHFPASTTQRPASEMTKAPPLAVLFKALQSLQRSGENIQKVKTCWAVNVIKQTDWCRNEGVCILFRGKNLGGNNVVVLYEKVFLWLIFSFATPLFINYFYRARSAKSRILHGHRQYISAGVLNHRKA